MISSEKLKKEYEEITQQLSSADTASDRENYARLSKRYSFLEKILKILKKREEYIEEKKHLDEILSNSREDEEVKTLAKEELESVSRKLAVIEDDIDNKIFEENEPQRDIIIEIRAAAGGEESALFVATLFKMYSHYIEKKGWKLEILSSHSTEIKGFKEVVFSVKGEGAYAHLKFESGVHRVQRVPVTEAGGRIHTSTVTVAVLVEPKEVDLKINPEDLRIDTFRASGAGGQHVNKTDSAVRITHLPTGIVVACQAERSQIKNREKAMRVLKARLMDKMKEEEFNKISRERRVQVGTGERSEKIRTYNFPERRVTDHRINLTLYQLEAVLEGEVDDIIKSLIKEERRKKYEAQGLA